MMLCDSAVNGTVDFATEKSTDFGLKIAKMSVSCAPVP